MTTISPRTGLRHILDLIDQGAPYSELLAAADKLANMLATPVFDLLRSHRDHDLHGVEVFTYDAPDKRLWIVEVRGTVDPIVTTVDEDWQSQAWFKMSACPLLVRPGGTRLTVPPEAPEAPGPRRLRTVAGLYALPDGSVIASGRETWQRAYDGWLVCNGDDPVPSSDIAGRAGPFTVLREGWGQ